MLFKREGLPNLLPILTYRNTTHNRGLLEDLLGIVIIHMEKYLKVEREAKITTQA